jgi:hypothetical protein
MWHQKIGGVIMLGERERFNKESLAFSDRRKQNENILFRTKREPDTF